MKQIIDCHLDKNINNSIIVVKFIITFFILSIIFIYIRKKNKIEKYPLVNNKPISIEEKIVDIDISGKSAPQYLLVFLFI